MTRRAAVKYPKDAEQWFIEPPSVAEQVFASVDLGGSVIYDPSCGIGTTLNVARKRKFITFGTDIVDRPGRHERHGFRRANFLKLTSFPFDPGDRGVSIFCNPPYGKIGDVDNMGEAFVVHALDHFRERCEHMAFILPIEFMAGQDRYFDIYEKREPAFALICNQRPSMPPGRKVEELARARNRRSLAGASLKYLPWSTADDIRVVKLRASGMPLELVAAEVGRTWAAVKSRLQKLAKQERSV